MADGFLSGYGRGRAADSACAPQVRTEAQQAGCRWRTGLGSGRFTPVAKCSVRLWKGFRPGSRFLHGKDYVVATIVKGQQNGNVLQVQLDGHAQGLDT